MYLLRLYVGTFFSNIFKFISGECRCQDDLVECIDPEGLHCYPKNSRGPCEEGEILIQPDKINKNGEMENPFCKSESIGLRSSIFNDRNGFGTDCEDGKEFDKITQKCVQTFTHNNNSISKRRTDISIGRHTDILKFLQWKIKKGNKYG